MTRSSSKKNKTYKFVQNLDVFIKTDLTDREFDSPWLKITPTGRIWVKGSHFRGYAWDGCSPKFSILDFTFGTPDGSLDYETVKPITYYASLFHDAIYQYKATVPISRREADKLFYFMLKERKFFWAPVYYVCVRLFGRFYGKWSHRKTQRPLHIERASWLNDHLTKSIA